MKLELKNGILYGTFKADSIDLNIAKKIVETRLQFINGRSYPMIFQQDGLKSINKEARNYFNSDLGIKGVSAGAIIAKNVFEAHLANFFIKISAIKVKVPTKVFKDEKEALLWLKQF
ncbi:MAG: hypothetical protein ABJG68_14860 [Crocinitomicaceae bacterium]